MLTILRRAGRDSERHRLVAVECSLCHGSKLMRERDVKRAKSCGCLEKAAFAKASYPKTVTEPKGFWSQWYASDASPTEILRQAKIALRGKPYEPFAKLTAKNRKAA